MIKKISLSLFFGLGCTVQLYLQAQVLSGDTWAKVKQQGSGTVVLTYINAPGLAFTNTRNQPDGVCVDIVKSFIDYLRLKKGVIVKAKITPEVPQFDRFLTQVRTAQGGVFGLGNITITEARQQQYSFTPPLLNNVSFLLTQSNVPTLSGLKEIATQFKGLKAYTVKGTTNEQVILGIKKNHFPTLQIVYVASSSLALKKVVEDNRSFTYLDFNFYSDAGKNLSDIKRHPIGDNSSEKFGIIMPPNSDWKALWDEFFIQNRFLKSYEYRKILLKHLGESAVSALDRFQD
jgi:putative glutamine transport system substrate-binding protein